MRRDRVWVVLWVAADDGGAVGEMIRPNDEVTLSFEDSIPEWEGMVGDSTDMAKRVEDKEFPFPGVAFEKREEGDKKLELVEFAAALMGKEFES